MRQKKMVMSPAGTGTKNDCAGEGQQFTPTEPISYQFLVMGTEMVPQMLAIFIHVT
jgi:hypothetical protein